MKDLTGLVSVLSFSMGWLVGRWDKRRPSKFINPIRKVAISIGDSWACCATDSDRESPNWQRCGREGTLEFVAIAPLDVRFCFSSFLASHTLLNNARELDQWASVPWQHKESLSQTTSQRAKCAKVCALITSR